MQSVFSLQTSDTLQKTFDAYKTKKKLQAKRSGYTLPQPLLLKNQPVIKANY